jgi:hypothetical protein
MRKQKPIEVIYEESDNIDTPASREALERAYDILFNAAMRTINEEKEKNKE